MTLQPGAKVWVPCQVRRGVFPDERNVVLESVATSWSGYVSTGQLKDQIDNGRTALMATVVEASNGQVSLRLPGQAVHASYLTGPEEQFEKIERG